MGIPFYVAPEQIVQDKVEYCRKGIAKSKSLVVLEFADGLLLTAENPSATLNKISEVYYRIAFAGAGRYSEFDNLRKAAIRYADLKGYAYSREDVTVRSLANSFSQVISDVFTQQIKPLEVEILVVEVGGPGRPDNSIFHILYDGSITDRESFASIGGQTKEVESYLAEHYGKGMGLEEALRLSRDTISHVEKRAIAHSQLEGALLEAKAEERAFRRLSDDEVQGLLEQSGS
jgi:proteasome alpha subunit